MDKVELRRGDQGQLSEKIATELGIDGSGGAAVLYPSLLFACAPFNGTFIQALAKSDPL